jgi:glycosyltransferase involved in cell wall biosynthesis
LYKRIFKSANYVLVVSDPLRLAVIRTYGLEKSKVLVFRNGVDTQKFRPEVRDTKLLRHTLKAKNESTLLFIGKIREERGLTALIEALPNIIAKTPHISAVFVGGGPQKSDVQKLAQKLDVEDSLKFLPAVDHDEVPKYICMADIAVGPLVANIDTFGSVPRKVLEYMACAKPVVACRGGVSSDLILDGSNGFLFTKGNKEELASIILKLINNPALAYEVGLNARKHAETFYDWDKIVGEFEKVLSQAVAESSC